MTGSGPADASKSGGRALGLCLLALGYVAAVLLIDTLAIHGRLPAAFNSFWNYDWQPVFYAPGFKVTVFVFWFIVPVVLSLRHFDTSWFGYRRWQRMDYAFLFVMLVAGTLAIATVAVFPSLRNYYPGFSGQTAALKWGYFGAMLLYNLSWLLGWEFMHRYFLLTRLESVWPRYGWLLIPLYEGVYHLQKPMLEAMGMVAFSLVMTFWARKRCNMLLPFLVHLFIEVALVAFLALG